MASERIVLAWSGGKDSALALDELKREGRYDVVSLLTTVAAADERVTHHGVPTTLVARQAEAVGIPLHVLPIDENDADGSAYAALMERTMLDYARHGLQKVAFGDIFLQSLREYREMNLARVGMEAIFPLWGSDTRHLAKEFIRRGFKARLASIDGSRLDGSFVGRAFDEALLDDLPPTVDPCGELGEYHTFVHYGPIFSRPVAVRTGSRFSRHGLHLIDLIPDDSSTDSIRVHSITDLS